VLVGLPLDPEPARPEAASTATGKRERQPGGGCSSLTGTCSRVPGVTHRWLRYSRRRISNAAGPLTSDGRPAAYSPVSTDHVAHTAAFPKMIQYVVAESPSIRSLRRNVRTACGIVSRQLLYYSSRLRSSASVPRCCSRPGGSPRLPRSVCVLHWRPRMTVAHWLWNCAQRPICAVWS
jgi:hypothetical protein